MLFVQEQNFESVEENSSEESEPQPKRTRGETKEWAKIYENILEKKEFKFKKLYKNENFFSINTVFKCCSHIDCDYQFMVKELTDQIKSEFYQSGSHSETPKTIYRGLSPLEKANVEQIFLSGITMPKLIEGEYFRLHSNHLDMKKLNSYLKALRKKHFGQEILYLNELEAKFLELSGEPEDLYQCFVPKYTVNYDSKRFVSIFSTNSLLDKLKKFTFIQADATYKLNWKGYPVFVFGASDQNRVFIALSSFALVNCKDKFLN